jgi:hypothetical protein
VPDHRRPELLVAVVALLATSCASATSADRATEPAGGDGQLAVVVASFDLAVGQQQRFLSGVFTSDRHIVGGGQVEMTFSPPGDDQTRAAAGRFLPVPGSGTPQDLPAPTVLGEPAAHEHAPGEAGSPHDHGEPDAAGVYQTHVDLDRAGLWEVTVTATVDGSAHTGSAVFEVAHTHQVPAVGDPAPHGSTPTLDGDLPLEAIDSRAGIEGEVPDKILHATDLAGAIAAGRPTVAVFSTPTYCTSRFCGPITDTVEQLAHRYADRAAFVHVEIWRDVSESRISDAVAEWIATDTGGNEPWVFLISADGTITARWDNVLDEAELVSLLEQLPEG